MNPVTRAQLQAWVHLRGPPHHAALQRHAQKLTPTLRSKTRRGTHRSQLRVHQRRVYVTDRTTARSKPSPGNHPVQRSCSMFVAWTAARPAPRRFLGSSSGQKQAADVVEGGADVCDRAAAVCGDCRVRALVAEHVARRRELRRRDALPVAHGADACVSDEWHTGGVWRVRRRRRRYSPASLLHPLLPGREPPLEYLHMRAALSGTSDHSTAPPGPAQTHDCGALLSCGRAR